MTPFDSEMSEILYGDLAAEVADLQGMRCSACGEVEYEPESASRYAEAGDAMIRVAKDCGPLESVMQD